MELVTIDEKRCRGCELCRQACPKGALAPAAELNADGYHPMQLQGENGCTGCAMCALMCPHVAITRVVRPK